MRRMTWKLAVLFAAVLTAGILVTIVPALAKKHHKTSSTEKKQNKRIKKASSNAKAALQAADGAVAGVTALTGKVNALSATVADANAHTPRLGALVRLSKGDPAKDIVHRGPVTVSALCTDAGSGSTKISIRFQSSDGGLTEGSPPLTLTDSPQQEDSLQTSAAVLNSRYRAVMTSSGTVLIVAYTYGLNVLGADCVASGMSFGQ